MSPRHRVALATILLLALAIRLGWAARQSSDPAALESLPDQREYFQLGQNLLAGRGLQFTDARFNQQVWAYRTPGYPALIAACGARIPVIRVVQAMLDATVVWAVYLLARNWLSPGRSLIAAALVAINPLLIYFSGLLLSETLFTAMLAWGMVLLLRRPAMAIRGAALLALAVLVRPSAIALPVLLALVVPHRRRLILAAACAILTLTALLPWAVRNHLRLNAWIWTSTNAGITRYDGFNPGATGASDQSFVANMPELAGMGEVERSDYLARLAGQFIHDHPSACIRLAIFKIGRLWSPLPLSRRFGQGLYVGACLAYSLPVMLLALASLWLGGLPARAKVPLMIVPLYFTVIHGASVSSLRYRLPAEPLLAILAVSAVGKAAAESST